MKLNPLFVAFNYHLDLLKGNVKISRNMPPNNTYPAGFHPFLFVQVQKPISDSAVRLLVKFKVRKLNYWQKTILPILSIPFFAGAPGFLDKSFLLNEPENMFCGYYTWGSRDDAEIYINSYPAKMMANNALPDTLSMDITPLSQ